MGFFGTAHGMGGAKMPLLPKIFHTYPKMMKLGTVMPYLKRIPKYINHLAHPMTSAFFLP